MLFPNHWCVATLGETEEHNAKSLAKSISNHLVTWICLDCLICPTLPAPRPHESMYRAWAMWVHKSWTKYESYELYAFLRCFLIQGKFRSREAMIAVSAAIQGQHFRVAQPHLLTPGRVAPMIALRLPGRNPSLFATRISKSRKVWLEPRSKRHLRHSRHSFVVRTWDVCLQSQEEWSLSTWSMPLTCALHTRHRAKSLNSTCSVGSSVDWRRLSVDVATFYFLVTAETDPNGVIGESKSLQWTCELLVLSTTANLPGLQKEKSMQQETCRTKLTIHYRQDVSAQRILPAYASFIKTKPDGWKCVCACFLRTTPPKKSLDRWRLLFFNNIDPLNSS